MGKKQDNQGQKPHVNKYKAEAGKNKAQGGGGYATKQRQNASEAARAAAERAAHPEPSRSFDYNSGMFGGFGRGRSGSGYRSSAYKSGFVTMAFPGAAEKVRFFGDIEFPAVDKKHKLAPSFMRAVSSGNDWIIRRTTGPIINGEPEGETQVIFTGPMDKKMVVSLMKDWATKASTLCGNGRNVESLKDRADIVTSSTRLEEYDDKPRSPYDF